MSKSSNYAGKTIVVDEVVQLAQKNDASMDFFASQLQGDIQKLTKGQVEYNNTYSISVSGTFTVTDIVDAEITLNVYRNGTKLSSSDSVVFGSSVTYVSETGSYKEHGEYASHYKRTITLSDMSSNTESIRVIWTGVDNNAVPISTTIKLDVGERTQYIYSPFTDEGKVKTIATAMWFDTIEGAKTVSFEGTRYLWLRRSTYYNFAEQQFTEWKYYKTDLEYDNKSSDDTADETIRILTPEKYIYFLFDHQTFLVDKRSNDCNNLTFHYEHTGYKTVEVTTGWSVTGCTLTESQKTAQSITVQVPFNTDLTSITVSVTVTCDGKEHPWSMTLNAVDVTAPEQYYGVVDTLPTGDGINGHKVCKGDWCVFKDTAVMYVWNGSQWVGYDSAEDMSVIPLEKVSGALVDLINLGTNDRNTATLLGVFKALCADRAFIKYLQVWGLYVGADKFSVDIAEYDRDTGEKLAKPVFIVSYDGTVVFQINASTGDIFIGTPVADLSAPSTGFMYDASERMLTTKGSNFRVMENGDVYGYFKQVTQFLPFSFEDSLDSSHPFECDFVIPSNATIKKITLSVKALAYRAYSSGAEYESKMFATTGGISWSSVYDTVSISLKKTYYSQYYAKSFDTSENGSHSHTYTKATGLTTDDYAKTNTEYAHSHSYDSVSISNDYTGSSNGHTHSYSKPTISQKNTGTGGQHSHTYTKATGLETDSYATTGSTGSHSHTYTIPAGLLTDVTAEAIKIPSLDHTHDIDVSHGHELVYGIHEGTSPTDVKIYYDNGDGYDSGESLGTFTKITDKVLVGSNVQKFTGSGWKSIKFTSSTLGRLRVQMMIELRVDTTE